MPRQPPAADGPHDITVTERWVCIGTRLSHNDKRCNAWLTPAGDTKLYAGRESYVTGAVYEVQVRHTPDGHTVRVGSPRYVGSASVSDERLATWRAEEISDLAELARQARERKAKRDGDGPLEEAMAPLLAIAAQLRTSDQKNALIADVIRRMSMAWTGGGVARTVARTMTEDFADDARAAAAAARGEDDGDGDE
jgi:hypothetical protein